MSPKNEKIRAQIVEWAVDPVKFVREVMGAEPEPWQAEAMMALVTNSRVAVRSGHGVGKTTALAWTILWWLCTRRPCKVAVTANTAHQLSGVGDLLRRAYENMRDSQWIHDSLQ